MKKLTLLLTFCSLLLVQNVLNAGVIQLSNQSPIIAIFGLPAPVDFVDTKRNVSLNLNVANNFVPRVSADEQLFLDGETSRLVTHYRQRLSNCWVLGTELPLIHHSGGVLDTFVDRWHEWFDLPESGRPSVETDRLDYQYTVNGALVLQQDQVVSGLGDISIILTQREQCSQWGGKVIRAGVKLPSGDPDYLFGSGSTNLFLDASQRVKGFYRSLDVSYTAGVVLMGESRLPVEHYRQVAYGTLSFELAISPQISLDAQVAIQSPHIKSDLRVLSDWPVQLLVGGSIQVSKSLNWHTALSEDPEYGTSSDVVFQMGMTTSF